MVCECGKGLPMHTKSERVFSYEWTEKESPKPGEKGIGNHMHYSDSKPQQWGGNMSSLL